MNTDTNVINTENLVVVKNFLVAFYWQPMISQAPSFLLWPIILMNCKINIISVLQIITDAPKVNCAWDQAARCGAVAPREAPLGVVLFPPLQPECTVHPLLPESQLPLLCPTGQSDTSKTSKWRTWVPGSGLGVWEDSIATNWDSAGLEGNDWVKFRTCTRGA